MVNEQERMICIHSHVLYGVDDGAEDFSMAKMLMMYARENGIYQMFLTPHSISLKCCYKEAEAAFVRLKTYLEDKYPDMAVYTGCEVYCESRMMDQVLQNLKSGLFPTLNHTAYVLAELSPWTDAEDAYFCVETLAKNGYIPVLAHLERYQALRGDLVLVEKLRGLGAMVQVNVGSLYDGFDNPRDPEVCWARELVREKKVDFLGTDCHRTYHRPPDATMGLQYLEKMVENGMLPWDYVYAITCGNAKTMLIG